MPMKPKRDVYYSKFYFRISLLLFLPILLGGCGLAKLASIQGEGDLAAVRKRTSYWRKP